MNGQWHDAVRRGQTTTMWMMTMTTRLEPMPDDYTTSVDAIASALLTSLRPGAAAETLRTAAVEMATKLNSRRFN
jgi:hypothetical protein